MKIANDHDFTRILFPSKLATYWDTIDWGEVLVFVCFVSFLVSANWGSHT